MLDIITFGSATFDIFLKPKKFQIEKDKNFITGKGVCFNLGSKVDVEKMSFSSGGGGTNTAATFSKQGFKTAYCGIVGNDISGKEIIRELKELGINTDFISQTKKRPTNLSVILVSGKDRTILVYRGASEIFSKNNVPRKKIRSKWFYLAPLAGMLCNISEDIVNFAYKNKIKTAFNPGNSQLSLPPKTIKRILKKIDILILNQEEASFLTKISYQKEKEIFKKIDELCPGIAIMTKGRDGVVVSDGKYLYKAKAPNVKVVDGTGAGDAFGSGFVTGFIKSGGNIKSAIQLGTANGISCIKSIGAKAGLLAAKNKFLKVKVLKESCKIK